MSYLSLDSLLYYTNVSLAWENLTVKVHLMWTCQWSLKLIMQWKVIVFNWSSVCFPTAINEDRNTFLCRTAVMGLPFSVQRLLEYLIDGYVLPNEAACNPAGASIACLLTDWMSKQSTETSLRGGQAPGGQSNGCQQPGWWCEVISEATTPLLK